MARKIIRKATRENKNKDEKNKQSTEKKIKHLEKVQAEWDKQYKNPVKPIIPTDTPHRLREYSGLSIFGLPKDLPKKQDLLGPFICDGHIILSDGERSVLSRDPKYSLMTECDREDFDTELERSLAKHRYGVGIKKDAEEGRKKKENMTKPSNNNLDIMEGKERIYRKKESGRNIK